MFLLLSTTKMSIRHLDNAIITTTEKKLRKDRSKGKVMVKLCFESSGIVHMEFIT